MIRRTLGACALLLVALVHSADAQVVGHLPSESPFTDATGRHVAAAHLGFFLPSTDPAGVGPQGGLMLMGRYEYDVPGPLWLTARGGFAPSTTRNVKDPLFADAQRNSGTRSETIAFADWGLALSLTGDKAWKGLAPRAHGNMGAVGSLNSDYDVGGYRFGPKLMLSYGLGVRGVSAGRWEWSVDLTHAFWRMQYPASYKDGGAVPEPSILGTDRTNPWSGNLFLTGSISRVWGK